MTNESLDQELSQEQLSLIHGGDGVTLDDCFDWVEAQVEEAEKRLEAAMKNAEALLKPAGKGGNNTWTGYWMRDKLTGGKHPML